TRALARRARDSRRMDLRISGKRAAVAAASKGLGFAAAHALAAEGVRVALGGVDILVPNAGGPPAGDFAAFDDVEAYARAFELNALSTIAMCKAAVPAMQGQ